jgi:hypothetical protein
VAVVISEERGEISLSLGGGIIRHLTTDALRSQLQQLILAPRQRRRRGGGGDASA